MSVCTADHIEREALDQLRREYARHLRDRDRKRHPDSEAWGIRTTRRTITRSLLSAGMKM